MLGWQIYVNRSPARPLESATEDSCRDNTLLATWLTGINGCDWIKKLVDEGKAKYLGTYGGYPRSYSAKAKVIIPLVLSLETKTDGPTVIGDDYAYIGGFNSNVELFLDRIKACTSDEELSIEAWDQS